MPSFLEAREGNSRRAICTKTDHHSLDLQGSHCALEFLREKAVKVHDWLAYLGAFSFPRSCLKAISGSSAFDWSVVLRITIVCTVFPTTLGDFHRWTFKGWCEGGKENWQAGKVFFWTFRKPMPCTAFWSISQTPGGSACISGCVRELSLRFLHSKIFS